jgi:hypothetical protein
MRLFLVMGQGAIAPKVLCGGRLLSHPSDRAIAREYIDTQQQMRSQLQSQAS